MSASRPPKSNFEHLAMPYCWLKVWCLKIGVLLGMVESGINLIIVNNNFKTWSCGWSDLMNKSSLIYSQKNTKTSFLFESYIEADNQCSYI